MANPKTGERAHPEKYNNLEEYLIYLKHLFAYNKVDKKREFNIIDIGCGEGYGTNILSQNAKIVGLGLDDEVIEEAKRKYKNFNIGFVQGTVFKLPFPDEHFNCAVSFQVIEHITNTFGYLTEINRVLKSGSRIYLETPNKASRLELGEKPFNRFHPIEFNKEELSTELNKVFKNVKIFGLRATEEIESIENARIKRIKSLIRKDIFGLRHYVPQWAIDFLVKKQPNFDKGKYDKKDYYLVDEPNEIDKAIDLYVECEKP